MRLHVWTDLAPPRQAQASNFDCNNAPCSWHDLGLVALPTALYLQHYLVSFVRGTCVLRLCCRFHVRGATLLSISQTRKWFPSLWSLKSKSPVISTCLSKESALPGVFVDFSVARGELPPPRCGCWRSHRRAESNALYQSLKLSVLPLHADLPWKVLVVFNHPLLKSFLQRKKQSLPNVRLHVLLPWPKKTAT